MADNIIKKIDSNTVEITIPAVITTMDLKDFIQGLNNDIAASSQRIQDLKKAQDSYNDLIAKEQINMDALQSQIDAVS